MKIHSALLKREFEIDSPDQSQIEEYKKDIEEWFVRWKELVILLAETQYTHQLLSWGELNYHHGLFLVSMLSLTQGVQALSLCDNISKAARNMAQQQLLFGHLSQPESQINKYFIFPMNWTVGHLVGQVGLHLVRTDLEDLSLKTEKALTLGRCLSVLSSLEMDPSNLLTGQAMILEDLSQMRSTKSKICLKLDDIFTL